MSNSFLQRNHILLSLCLLVLFSSCSGRYRNALFSSKSDQVTDSLKEVHVVNSSTRSTDIYRIRPADVLAIRNLQDISFISGADSKGSPSQPTTFRVGDDGTVVLPSIGKVPVTGLSREEARDKIQSLYKQTLLKDPIIELSIINLKVTLLGEFSAQGSYFLEDDNTSLIDIIGKAGGISQRADPKTLKIIRGDRTNPEIIYVNLKNINSLANPKLRLQNNDIIYIEPLKVYNTSDRINSVSTVLQPVLLIINFALIIYNFAK